MKAHTHIQGSVKTLIINMCSCLECNTSYERERALNVGIIHFIKVLGIFTRFSNHHQSLDRQKYELCKTLARPALCYDSESWTVRRTGGTRQCAITPFWIVKEMKTLEGTTNSTNNNIHMKNGVFWDVTPCGSCKNRRFGGT
jgi:hypothetical protein